MVRLREGFAYERESVAVLVRLKHDGEPGAVIATGFVLNPENGYSTTFGFVDPQSIVTNRLAGAHVWFGYPDNKEGFPQDTKFRAPLILANVSDKPVKARVSVDYTLSATAASLGVAEERIGPGETKVIELTEEMAKLGIAGPVEDAGVDITYDGAPGSLIAHLTSVDQTGDFSLETPIKDPGEVMHMSGNAHPWSLQDGTRTALHLKNTTDKPVAVLVQIRFSGGSYNPDRIILQPFQTIAIDMQELKDSKKKDIRGNIFPQTAMGGLVEWIEQTPKAVIGRAEHVNVGQGIARSFSCPMCPCPNFYLDSWMSPSSVTKSVGDSGYFFSPQERQQDCNGTELGPYPPPQPNTWSATGSAATVDIDGRVHAVAAGSSTISNEFQETNSWYWTPDGGGQCQNSGYFPVQVSGTVSVHLPDQIVVQSDVQQTLNCSGNPLQRKITYEITDASGAQVVSPISVREQFTNRTANSCGGPVQTSESCTLVSGGFTDTLTPGCVVSGHSTPCGFGADRQQWQWCNPNGTTPSVGTPGALSVNTNAISVGGNFTGYSPGYKPPK